MWTLVAATVAAFVAGTVVGAVTLIIWAGDHDPEEDPPEPGETTSEIGAKPPPPPPQVITGKIGAKPPPPPQAVKKNPQPRKPGRL